MSEGAALGLERTTSVAQSWDPRGRPAAMVSYRKGREK